MTTFILVVDEREDQDTTISGPSLNGVSLACR